eukprot:scpid111101/ scgid12967/ 
MPPCHANTTQHDTNNTLVSHLQHVRQSHPITISSSTAEKHKHNTTTKINTSAYSHSTCTHLFDNTGSLHTEQRIETITGWTSKAKAHDHTVRPRFYSFNIAVQPNRQMCLLTKEKTV